MSKVVKADLAQPLSAEQRLQRAFCDVRPGSVAGDDRSAVLRLTRELEDMLETSETWDEEDDEFLRNVRRVVDAWS